MFTPKQCIPILFLLLLCSVRCFCQEVSVCSWNIQNFGKSKDDAEIEFIANTVKGYDAVAIIEVVAGYGGAQAVARLSDVLNRKGAKWDYVISDPTSSTTKGTERYAFLWKTSRLRKQGDAWLEKKYHKEIEREPYFITFKTAKKAFTLAAFHAVPTSKKPEKEIIYLQKIPVQYKDKNILFCGDYNCSQSNEAFSSLKAMGYQPIFAKQKTTIKNKPKGAECLASEYDNIFYQRSQVKRLKSGIIPFYTEFATLKDARKISDHVPIYFEFSLN
ncbi:MAG TPA: endonuclease/exonuclease/phosphatase family protein [Flavipsychrobacter sp.]|nr:endonuclease/exonuclease/phosphatase family protein [Flavipsychrobacter sp.]